MNFLFKIIDFFYQKKKYSFLKKRINNDINIFIDIGAHHGDTISDFLEIFSINTIYAFEPSKENFNKLKAKKDEIEKSISVKIKIFPYGLGNKNDVLQLNEIADGVSNTFNALNINSRYFKRKKFITTLFGIKKFIKNKVPTKVIRLKEFIEREKIDKIDFIKIDTEGFEFNILLGLENDIKKVKFILFEHHYDNMIIKNYKYSDIHKLLTNSGFKKIYKTKMPFRKSFDYIYKKN